MAIVRHYVVIRNQTLATVQAEIPGAVEEEGLVFVRCQAKPALQSTLTTVRGEGWNHYHVQAKVLDNLQERRKRKRLRALKTARDNNGDT